MIQDFYADIANDMKTSKIGFYDVAKDIITKDSLTIMDSFKHQGNKVDMYNGVQNAIKNSKDLQDKLSKPNLTKKQKDEVLRAIASSVAKELNIKLSDVSTVASNSITKDGNKIKGAFHESSLDIAINDVENSSTSETVNSLGNEMSHLLDTQRGEKREGTTSSGESYKDEYSNLMGDSMEDYTNFAMYNYTDGKTLASTNNHIGLTAPTSVFDSNYNKASSNFENRNRNNELEYRQYIGIRGGDPVKATGIKSLNSIPQLAGHELRLNASGETISEIKEKSNNIAKNDIEKFTKQTLVIEKNPKKYIDTMVNISGEKKVIEVVNNEALNDNQKIELLNDLAKEPLSYDILNTDSSIITVGEKILEKDATTKTMIFESGRKEEVLKLILKQYEKGEQIIMER